MILGDESFSGKLDIFQLFTLTDLVESMPQVQEMKELPPCDIETKVLETVDLKDSKQKKRIALELWLPPCIDETSSLRPLYYPGTDIFILVFSIKEKASFLYLKNVILPELKKYNQENEKEDIPILLVGNHAEVRNDESFEGELVQSQDAFNLAQENDISKYIEIFSENLFHIHEIFQQAALVIFSIHGSTSLIGSASFSGTSTLTKEDRLNRYAKEHSFLKSQLTLTSSECNFSQIDRTFELITQSGVEYFYTLDGSNPTKLSKKYTGPIVLKSPYPKEIRTIAISRCKYQSEISIFKMPGHSTAPFGYFDPITKAFHIQRKADTIYFLTTDGSTPTTNSTVYTPPGLFFDGKKINGAFEKTPNIPEVIKVIAIEEGKFASKSTSFYPYSILPAPNATLKDNFLKVDPIPGVAIRYTFDGSNPTFDSPEVGPDGVQLPSDADLENVKLASFPKLAFPSTVQLVKQSRSKSPKSTKGSSSKLNRSTKKSDPTSPTNQGLNNSSNQLNVSGNQSLNNSARKGISKAQGSLNSPSRGSSPIRRSSSPAVRPQRGLKSSLTKKEQEVLISRKALFSQIQSSNQDSPQRKSQEFKVVESTNTQNNASSKNSLVKCKADGTNIEFTFEKPVYLSSVVVKTPGNGEGPHTYEFFNIDENSAEITRIGFGELKDELEEQIMSIDENFTSVCTKMLCTFQMRPGQVAFKILDMKVDCRVA